MPSEGTRQLIPTSMVARKARVRFALFLGVFVLLVLLTHQNPLLMRAMAPVDLSTARVTATILHLCGISVIQELTILSHPSGFSYEIYYHCTGLVPAAFLAVGIFAFPTELRRKFVAVVLGVPLLLLLNLIRLVSLFYVGVWYPNAFYLAHTIVWEGLFILYISGFLVWWMRLGRGGGKIEKQQQDNGRCASNLHLIE